MRVVFFLIFSLMLFAASPFGFASTRSLRAGESGQTIRGRIIAYRPAERIAQMASFVANHETFLFERSGRPRREIVKLVFDHMGYSSLNPDSLTPLTLTVTRVPKCDETYSSYSQNSPAFVDQDGNGGSVKGVVFLPAFENVTLTPDQILKCYRIDRMLPGHQVVTSSELQDAELSRNMARWDQNGPRKYIMRVSQDAHGATRSKQDVFINVNGDTISVRPVKRGDQRPLYYFDDFNTIPKLFTQVHKLQEAGWRVRVGYDSKYGYPKFIRGGDPKSTAWWTYEVLSLKVR